MNQKKDARVSLAGAVKEWLGNDDITRHGLIMISFSVLSNSFMYFYQLAMGILLSSYDYGILVSLISLISIFMVASQTIGATASRLISQARASDGIESAGYLWHLVVKRVFLIGLFVLLIIGVLSPVIAGFLRLNSLSHVLVLLGA